MTKQKRRWVGVGIAGVLLLLLGVLLLFPPVRSMAVMKVYSRMNERKSLSKDTGLWISMPGGWTTKEKDWYPFVMTFNDDAGFSAYCGQKSRLTILYNFGAFDLKKSASTLYNEESPYYNSFYGAYLVQQDERAFGFDEEGKVDPKEIALVPRYDFFHLVLDDFGLLKSEEEFAWMVTKQEEGVVQAGMDGWTKIRADLRVNGANHVADGFVTSYLQYGAPGWECETPFAPVDMKGIVYVRYFPEEKVSVFLYALCAEETALNRCDTDILSKTKIDKH